MGYAYNTLIGPIGVTVNTSNWEDNVGIYFNMGFYF